MSREKLFTITANDCRWDYYHAQGHGGQKVNKTSSACRCTHLSSGAVGQAQDDRSQYKNRRLAFKRMAETKQFKEWVKLEVSRRNGELIEIGRHIDRDLLDSNKIKIEVFKNGRWIEEQVC